MTRVTYALGVYLAYMVIIESSRFTSRVKSLLSDEEYSKLQDADAEANRTE